MMRPAHDDRTVRTPDVSGGERQGVVPLLTVRGLSRRFAGLEALRDVSVDVAAGEVLAIIGPNGAGKTTLLNIVSGALRPSAGSVELHGRPIAGLPAHRVSRAGVARTFQSLELFKHLTVFENVMTGGVAHTCVGVIASMLGLPAVRRQRATLEAEALDTLRLVGLDARADELAGSLPAGQQRLLAVARALASGGELVILDEPGAGLNQTEKLHLAEVIARLPGRGKTVLFVEHDMTLVGRLADRIVVLNHGRKIAEGSPDEVRNHPRVIEAYLGVKTPVVRATGAGFGDARASTASDAAVASVSPGDGPRGRATTGTTVNGPADGEGPVATRVVDGARSDALPMLRVTDVEVAYGGLRALQGVSLDVHRGEIVALVGANGAGKTTLLKAVARVAPLACGSIAFEGTDLARQTPAAIVRAGISMVPEGRELFSSLTVWDNLVLGRYAQARRGRAEIDRLTDEVFALFPALAARRRQLAGTLSGGEGQMLAIGRALMSTPRLLMLDEPSLGLAPQIVAEILERLGRLRAGGLTIVLVEQNARAALELADRGYVLETGRVVTTGTGAALLRDPEIASAYLGRAADRLTGAAGPAANSAGHGGNDADDGGARHQGATLTAQSTGRTS